MHFLIECPISVPLDPRESVLDRYVVLERLVLWEKQMKATWLEDSKWVDSTLSCEGSELENVKSFTRTNINKPDFTPRKACKSRHF